MNNLKLERIYFKEGVLTKKVKGCFVCNDCAEESHSLVGYTPSLESALNISKMFNGKVKIEVLKEPMRYTVVVGSCDLHKLHLTTLRSLSIVYGAKIDRILIAVSQGRISLSGEDED